MHRPDQPGLRRLIQSVGPFALVVLVACWVFFAELGSFPLFNPDEGLYAEPAREMLDTGEYLTTLLNYVVRFTKPPLVIWSMAGCYKVLGVSEFAARFFGASCGAVLVAATYGFLARYAGVRAALLGSAMLVTAPLFVGTGREAITDMPLSLFVAGSLICFYRAHQDKERFWSWLAYVLVGLAVMTKGPIGLILPVVILASYHLLRGSWREALKFYCPQWGLLIVAAIAVPWFATEISVTQGAYFREFIMRENVQRFTSVVDSHNGGWWYHLVVMLGGFFPWSVFLPQALARSLARPASGSVVTAAQTMAARSGEFGPVWLRRLQQFLLRYRHLPAEQDVMLFCACWALVTLLLFSASVSKLIPYTVPAFPALAALAAVEICSCLQSGALARILAPFAGLAIIYGGAGLIGPAFVARLRDCPPDLFKIFAAYVSFQCLGTLLTIGLSALRKPLWALSTFTVLTLASSAFFGYRALCLLSSQWEGPLPSFSQYAATSDCPILVFDLRKPGVPFYTHRKVIQPASLVALQKELSGFKQAYVITKATNRSAFEQIRGCRTVRQEGKFLLVCFRRQS